MTRSVIVPTRGAGVPGLSAQVPGVAARSAGVAQGPRVLVAVHTSTEEIVNMGNMTVMTSGGMTSDLTSTTMSGMSGMSASVSVDPFDAILALPQYSGQLLGSSGHQAGQLTGVIRNECLDDAIDQKPVVSPLRLQILPQPAETSGGGVNILAELSDELSETLKKEVQDEVKKEESERKKKEDKIEERPRDKVRDKDRSKDAHKIKNRDREKDRHRDRDRDRKDRDKERDRRYKDIDESRRRDKEKQREKERKEKKPRESKPFRETEVRDGLDSAEKQRIKELAQKMRQEVKSLPKIPKNPKSNGPSVKEKAATLPTKAPVGIKKPSFTDLMNAMGTSSSKTVKAAPIKNKNRLLLESLEQSAETSSKSMTKTSLEAKKVGRTDYQLNFKTEDKSALVKSIKPEVKEEGLDEKSEVTLNPKEEKNAVKRPLEEEQPKLKIKSQSKLSEGSGFSDFLSTIIPEVPKRKKIKFSDLKAKKEASLKEEEAMKTDANEEADTKPTFSFYGGGHTEPEEEDKTSDQESAASPKQESEAMDVKEEETGPREVRGILVISKGVRRSRSLQWRPESQLVEIEYFEVEEGERVNVNKATQI